MSRVIVLLSVVLFSVYQTGHAHFLTDDFYNDQIYDEPTSEEAYFLTNDYINQINNEATTWKAGRNFPLATSVEYLKGMLGSKGVGLTLNGPVKTEDEDPNYTNFEDIPETFDAREQWEECQTIGHVRDQGNCGSSWALATTSALSDRMCIATDGEFNELLSAENPTFCCHYCGFGCHGGWPILAWYRFKFQGCCTGGDYGSDEGCQPYQVSPCTVDGEGEGYDSTCNDRPTERNHKCSRECYGNTTVDYRNDRVYTRDAYHLTFRAIQKDILCYGPIAASFDVHVDFLSYKSGVYAKTDNATYLGGHDGKLIGWGTEDDVPYWLVINSWNTNWGDNGTFKIKRGTNECRIDVSTTAGVPVIN